MKISDVEKFSEPKCPLCKEGILEAEDIFTISCDKCEALFDILELKLKSLHFNEDGDIIESKSNYYIVKIDAGKKEAE